MYLYLFKWLPFFVLSLLVCSCKKIWANPHPVALEPRLVSLDNTLLQVEPANGYTCTVMDTLTVWFSHEGIADMVVSLATKAAGIEVIKTETDRGPDTIGILLLMPPKAPAQVLYFVFRNPQNRKTFTYPYAILAKPQ